MKKLFFFLMLLGCYSGEKMYAQFNHGYNAGAGSVSWDVVSCNNGEFVTVSSDGFRRYDVNGNLLWQYYYYTPYLLPPSAQHPCKLVHTDDDGIIYLGLDSVPYYDPVLLKLDATGSLAWAKRYWTTHHYTPGVLNTWSMNMDIKRMHTSSEDYIISATTSARKSAVYPQTHDNVLEVMRINGSGRLIWNKQYTLSPPPASDIIKDYGNTVCYAGNDPLHGDLYYIAGIHEEHLSTGLVRGMFQLLIDEQGRMVKPFQKLQFPCGEPRAIYAVYDPREDKVVTSFTLGNCEIDEPTYSGIGIMSTDRALNTPFYNLYWLKGSTETQANRITRSPLNGDYLLSGSSYHPLMFDTLDTANFHARNMTLLRVNVDGNVKFYKHYMVEEMSGIPTFMDISLDVLQNERILLLSGTTGRRSGLQRTRLLATDMNGTVCGSHEFPLEQRRDYITPVTMNYKVDSMFSMADWMPQTGPVSTTIEYCTYDNEYNFRPAPLSAGSMVPVSSVRAYPTLLAGAETVLHIDMTVAEALDVRVQGVDGRLILERHYEKDAAGIRKLDLEQLKPGNYFVQVQSAARTVMATVKISRL